LIETERLLLRPPEERDVDMVYRFVSDPEVMRWIDPDGTVGTWDDAVRRIELYRRAWEIDGCGHFMVVPRGGEEAVGRVGLLFWEPDFSEHGTRSDIGKDAETELGWTLERAAWGKGYATEGALAVRDWVLRELQPRRLISLIHPDNVRSMRVAEKIGEEYRNDVIIHSALTVQLWTLPTSA
jgi:RimJ/RimL family protein N-acetyltransferase